MDRLHLRQIDWYQLLQQPSTWLLTLTVTLAGLHLTILDRSGQPNLMSLSILTWVAIASLLWDKRHELKFNSGVFSTFLGATLIALVLLRSISPVGYHLRVSPFVSGLGLCLMASGIKGCRQYWKELLTLGLLAFYNTFSAILKGIDLPTLTAKFSAAFLWAAGFDVYREGVFIYLPTGAVEVYESCSGVESIMLMFFVSCLFLLLIPINWVQRIVCVAFAVFLGFIVNCIRVVLMTILVAYSNQEAFKYWHGDDGSLIFAVISVAIFGLFCWLAYIRPLSVASEEGDF